MGVSGYGTRSIAAAGEDMEKRSRVFWSIYTMQLMTSVAIAGAIGFLGLVVPHFVRRVFGGNHRAYLPLSALFGGLFLLGADYAGRRFPAGVSAGVVCAVLGSPFFLWLLVLRRRR